MLFRDSSRRRLGVALRGRRWAVALLAVVVAVLVPAAACGDDDGSGASATPPSAATTAAGSPVSPAAAGVASIAGDTTGVTDGEVKIGSYAPKTGPVAISNDVNVGWQLYFEDVNKKGGIAGRQVKLIVEDDGYIPSNTVNVVKKLVEQDEVFMLFNGLGTANGLAVLDYLRQQGVPHLFVASGATRWAASGPGIIGLQPDYLTEGTVLGKEIADRQKGKKYGILYQNDDLGRDGREGLKKGVGDALTLVGEEACETSAPDVTSQALKLINAGAEVIGVYLPPAQFAGVLKNVKAQGRSVTWYSSYISVQGSTAKLADGAMDGVLTAGYTPDPTNPDPNVQKVVQFYKDHGIANPNSLHLYGWMAAEHLDRLLTVTGKNLNRSSIVYALENLAFQGDWKSTLLYRPTIITKDDRKPIEYMFIQRWNEATKTFDFDTTRIIDTETTRR